MRAITAIASLLLFSLLTASATRLSVFREESSGVPVRTYVIVHGDADLAQLLPGGLMEWLSRQIALLRAMQAQILLSTMPDLPASFDSAQYSEDDSDDMMLRRVGQQRMRQAMLDDEQDAWRSAFQDGSGSEVSAGYDPEAYMATSGPEDPQYSGLCFRRGEPVPCSPEFEDLLRGGGDASHQPAYFPRRHYYSQPRTGSLFGGTPAGAPAAPASPGPWRFGATADRIPAWANDDMRRGRAPRRRIVGPPGCWDPVTNTGIAADNPADDFGPVVRCEIAYDDGPVEREDGYDRDDGYGSSSISSPPLWLYTNRSIGGYYGDDDAPYQLPPASDSFDDAADAGMESSYSTASGNSDDYGSNWDDADADEEAVAARERGMQHAAGLLCSQAQPMGRPLIPTRWLVVLAFVVLLVMPVLLWRQGGAPCKEGASVLVAMGRAKVASEPVQVYGAKVASEPVQVYGAKVASEPVQVYGAKVASEPVQVYGAKVAAVDGAQDEEDEVEEGGIGASVPLLKAEGLQVGLR